MKSLLIFKFTNVFLLFHAVRHQIPLTLAAPWKIKAAEGIVLRQVPEDINAFQPIWSIAMHINDAVLRLGLSFGEERGVYLFIIGIDDFWDLMFDV